MIAVGVTALALASAGEACVVNRTDDWLAVVAWEETGRESIKFFRFDVGPRASKCVSIVSPGGNAFAMTASYLKQTSEDPSKKAQCPTIASGEGVRLVVAVANKKLECRREG